MDDIPADYAPAPLGSRAALVAKIQEVVPTANFSDPSWGLIDGTGWSIEVGMGAEEECDCVAFHVRGGDEAAGVVAEILQHLKLRAFDTQTGAFFSPGVAALESLRKWRAYRDRVAAGDG